MTGESHPSTFEYDVALSFASEYKATAEELAGLLSGFIISVSMETISHSFLFIQESQR